LSFIEEKHDIGSVRFLTKLNNTTFEISPSDNNNPPTKARLGLELPPLNETQEAFVNEHSDKGIVQFANGKKFALIVDPSGNNIELVWKNVI
jgi:hypothetical protein